MSEKQTGFKCRVCGGNEYEIIERGGSDLGSSLIGGPPLPMITVGYECKHCSVTFRDPVKFSENK